MEPLDLSVHSTKRHSEEPGTFQDRPLCLIKYCECQNGSLHPHLPLLHHEHQISCTAAADGYLWRIDDLTKQLQPPSETLIPCHTREISSTEDRHLNRPQSCPITSSATKWSRPHGTNNPGSENPQDGRNDPKVAKGMSNRSSGQKDVVSTHSTSDDKYSKKLPASDHSKNSQQMKLSTNYQENSQMDSEPNEVESQTVSKTSGTDQWGPLSPTSSVNRAPENYLNLMHHLLQGCASVTDMSVSVRNQHNSSNNSASAGRDQMQHDTDHLENNGQEKDEETAMEQDDSNQVNNSLLDSKNISLDGKNDNTNKETSENTNNDTNSSVKKSPQTDIKAANVTKVNALDYLISKYLVQNVDVPYKPCNRKIRELLNSGETKICFMDLIELQIEKSFTVPG